MKKINGLDTIIMIDDDDVTNFIHKRVVKKSDIEVDILIKNNGTSALQYLEEIYEHSTKEVSKSGIIFLDVNMPGMNGWDFIEEYKKLPDQLKNKFFITMLTTSFNPDDKHRANANSEINFFVKKPLTLAQLENDIIPSFCKYVEYSF